MLSNTVFSLYLLLVFAAKGGLSSQLAEPSAPVTPDIETLNWGGIVVNLDRRKDRLLSFTSSICERERWLAKKTCRLPAVDGKDLPTDAARRNLLVTEGFVENATLRASLSQSSGASSWNDLSPGAIALYVSHSKAWKHILVKGWDFGIVMEDDLEFYAADFEAIVQEVARKAREGWGVVQLQSCDAIDCEHQNRQNCWERGHSQRVSVDTPSRLMKLPSHQHLACTGAYAVSRRGAEALLANDFPIKKQLDIAITEHVMHGMPVLKAVPPVAQCNENRKGSDTYDSDVQYPGDTKRLKSHISDFLKSVRSFNFLQPSRKPNHNTGDGSVCSLVPTATGSQTTRPADFPECN